MDIGHDWTDEEIRKLERKFSRVYGQAKREMAEKLEVLMADYNKGLERWKRDLADGASQDDYDEWLSHMAHDRKFVGGMADALARDATRTDKLVADAINDAIPHVFAKNANMAAYGIEKGLGWDTHSFDLVDADTVRRLVKDEPALFTPIPSAKVDVRKDMAWNRQKFSATITQSVLQGESIPKTAARLRQVFDMDMRAATTAARTAMTGAENGGRVMSYKRAESIGIELEQQWMATLDARTRSSHRLLDGEHIPVGEKFSNGLEFPGDPNGPSAEVCNCRCTLVAWFPDIEQEDPERWSKLPEGMTYDEWRHEKLVGPVQSMGESAPQQPSEDLWKREHQNG